MTARSSCRGHATYWDEDAECWRYEDNDEPLPRWGGEIRACTECGVLHEGAFGNESPDPCLGTLPGVDNACCGHGDRELAYVRFTNGVVLKGFVVEDPP